MKKNGIYMFLLCLSFIFCLFAFSSSVHADNITTNNRTEQVNNNSDSNNNDGSVTDDNSNNQTENDPNNKSENSNSISTNNSNSATNNENGTDYNNTSDSTTSNENNSPNQDQNNLTNSSSSSDSINNNSSSDNNNPSNSNNVNGNVATGTDLGDQYISTVKLTDENGNSTNNNTYTFYSDIKANITFNIQNRQVHAGDYLTIHLPSVFKFHSLNSFVLKPWHGSSVSIATAYPGENNTLKVVFNNNVNDMQNISGEINLWINWVDSIKNQSITNPINTNWGHGITIPVNYGGNGSPANTRPVTKWTTNPSSRSITWNVILDGNNIKIDNAKFIDVLGSNELVNYNEPITIGDVNYDSNGNFSYATNVHNINVTKNLKGFEYDFPSELNHPVIITYTVDLIDNGQQEHYTNGGSLSGSNINTVPIDASTVVSSGNGNAGGNVAFTNVKVIKKWDDNNNSANERPSNITIKLLANGQIVQTQIIAGNTDTWSYDFTNLVKTDSTGKTINYSIDEVNVPNYTKQIDGYTIKNTYSPGGTPVNPVNPVNPVTPVNPVNPITPVNPINPIIPVNPVIPVNPINPIIPVDPTPVKPVYPIIPVNPNHHVIPADHNNNKKKHKPNNPNTTNKLTNKKNVVPTTFNHKQNNSNHSDSSEKTNKTHQLAQTGEQNDLLVQIIGMILLLIDLAIIMVTKKDNKNIFKKGL